MTSPVGDAKSLPLILARELASNLATPMFLIDAKGTLVFFNEAAELLIGRTFAELGEISALEFGATPPRGSPSSSGVRLIARSWQPATTVCAGSSTPPLTPCSARPKRCTVSSPCSGSVRPRWEAADARSSVGLPGLVGRAGRRHGSLWGQHLVPRG